MDWDLNDVRHFLAVARAGSASAAAKSLKVNQTTCTRRVTALEQAFGLSLFERSAEGYSLTPGGQALLEQAERIEVAATAMFASARELGRAARSEIRFSTSDVLADLVAGPAVAAFARLHPSVSVIFNADSRAVDLGRDEADVALRAHPVMDDPQLVVRKVMDTPWAFYCAASWVGARPMPTSPADVAAYPLATLEGRPAALLAAALPTANVRYVSNSMKALIEVIKGGECVAALPMMVGDAQADLVRCFAVDVDAGGLWIVFHERLRQAPHVRAFVDHLAAFVLRWRNEVQDRPRR